MTYFKVLTCVLLTLVSCSNKKESNSNKSQKVLVNNSDTIVRNIGEHLTSPHLMKLLLQTDSIIGLMPIIDGVNGKEIRIRSAGYSKNDILFILKVAEGDTSALYYEYVIDYSDKMDSILSLDVIEKKQMSPVNGWKPFLTQFDKAGLDTLPDFYKIPGYHLNADANGILLEISKKGYYKSVNYPHPEWVENEIVEAKKLTNVIRLIKSEFNKNITPPETNP